MDWQHVIERIAVNAGYIITIFTAIKYFVLNPLEKRRKKEDDEKIAEQNAFQERILKKTSENQKPLVEALDSLKQLIEDTRRESDNLHKIADVNVKAIGELDVFAYVPIALYDDDLDLSSHFDYNELKLKSRDKNVDGNNPV